jgi:hypothetical protein
MVLYEACGRLKIDGCFDRQCATRPAADTSGGDLPAHLGHDVRCMLARAAMKRYSTTAASQLPSLAARQGTWLIINWRQ